MQPLFSVKNFKSHKKVIASFFSINNFKVVRKWQSPFFSIKNFRSCKAVMELFLSFRSFKSCKEVTELFFSDHAFLSFIWCINFLEQYFLCQFPLNFFDYTFLSLTVFLWLYILISMKKDADHISAINGFPYIMPEAAVRSFPWYTVQNIFGNTGRRALKLVMTACGNFTFNWIFCVYSFS